MKNLKTTRIANFAMRLGGALGAMSLLLLSVGVPGAGADSVVTTAGLEVGSEILRIGGAAEPGGVRAQIGGAAEPGGAR